MILIVIMIGAGRGFDSADHGLRPLAVQAARRPVGGHNQYIIIIMIIIMINNTYYYYYC